MYVINEELTQKLTKQKIEKFHIQETFYKSFIKLTNDTINFNGYCGIYYFHTPSFGLKTWFGEELYKVNKLAGQTIDYIEEEKYYIDFHPIINHTLILINGNKLELNGEIWNVRPNSYYKNEKFIEQKVVEPFYRKIINNFHKGNCILCEKKNCIIEKYNLCSDCYAQMERQ